jgi:hypothetical protein
VYDNILPGPFTVDFIISAFVVKGAEVEEFLGPRVSNLLYLLECPLLLSPVSYEQQ